MWHELYLAVQSDEEADGDRPPAAEGGLAQEKRGWLGPKKEADYDYFVSDIWPRISSKEEKQAMTAPLVWQVPHLPGGPVLGAYRCTSAAKMMAGSQALLSCTTHVMVGSQVFLSCTTLGQSLSHGMHPAVSVMCAGVYDVTQTQTPTWPCFVFVFECMLAHYRSYGPRPAAVCSWFVVELMVSV